MFRPLFLLTSLIAVLLLSGTSHAYEMKHVSSTSEETNLSRDSDIQADFESGNELTPEQMEEEFGSTPSDVPITDSNDQNISGEPDAIQMDLGTAAPKITIVVDRSTQQLTLTITKDSTTETHMFPCSTGMPGHTTPSSTYPVTAMFKNAYSAKYKADMPNAVFFIGKSYAIHATAKQNYKYLGKQAVSHGCVRLTLEHSLFVYNLVKQYGPANTTITVI